MNPTFIKCCFIPHTDYFVVKQVILVNYFNNKRLYKSVSFIIKIYLLCNSQSEKMQLNIKRKTIDYSARMEQSNDIILPVTDYISIGMNNVVRYSGSFALLCKLSQGQRNLFDYLCEVMDLDNRVFNNADSRRSFLEYLYKGSAGEISYTEETVKVLFFQISKTILLIKGGQRSEYIVNPLYFSRNGNNREFLIRNLAGQGKISNHK